MKYNTIPLNLIYILADGKFHSCEQLSDRLVISNDAIKQNVQKISDWGINVFAVSGKGYSIQEPIQLLDLKEIKGYIDDNCNIVVLPVIDSTNQYMLDHISELNSGDVCIAEYQKAGRGRCGRKWFSPFGTNLYLSMYWRLEKGFVAAIGLSLVIGITMAEVLHKLGADMVRLKWPNDLYLKNRKLAGILVELTGKAGEAAVIGTGINLAMQQSQININLVNQDQGWINLQEAGISIDRNLIAACIIKELRTSLQCLEQQGLEFFLSRWAKLDYFINKPVKLIIGDKEIYGIYRGIDTKGALLLEQYGVIKPVLGGEIFLRKAEI